MALLLASALLLLAGTIFFYRAYRNTREIQINKINVSSNNGEQSMLSILHLSDLHLENISVSPEQLTEKIKDEPIDMIALTGDFLDRKKTIPKLIPYLKELVKIESRYGIYAVLGNHDYVLADDDLNNLKSVLQEYRVHVMQNESKTITINGKPVNIIGIDDYYTNRSNVPLAFKKTVPGTNIVLTHDPTIVLEMTEYRFDYLMAGHFHGGQICYPKAYHLAKMGDLARNNIIKGLHSHEQSPFYISEGLGQTGLNIRVGSRPEITFHSIPVCSVTSEKTNSMSDTSKAAVAST
ncbi:metallophosphoesterase [Virgibacillus kekensis]|uniref:Metallophosphoesterase n=1 Tax=Virgibacillus kekensis TaxID=202261 RepID=A0ABV9DI24_9BACI